MLDKLKDFGFIFLAVIFRHIFYMTNTLCRDLRAGATDAKACHERVKETCVTIYRQRNDSFFNNLQNRAIRILQQHYSPEVLSDDGIRKNYKPLYYEIIDNVIMELHTRFENIEQYEFFALGNTFNFEQNPASASSNDVATKLIDNLATHFPSEFPHKGDVRREWRKVAVTRRFWSMPLNKIISVVNDPISPSKIVYKLFSLILLLTPIDRDCGTMCLHKIRSYLDKSVAADMRPAMAKILMNQEVLSVLTGWCSFRDDILNKLSVRYSAIKLSYMVKVSTKTANQTPSVPVGLDPNLFASTYRPSTSAPQPSMVMDVDPITPDISGPSSVEGPSSRIEPDSSMDDNLTVTMTCEKFPVGEDYTQFADVKIKQEPEDPSDILSATVERELNSFSQDPPSASHKGGSLFQSPVLIKEEIVSSEEDL